MKPSFRTWPENTKIQTRFNKDTKQLDVLSAKAERGLPPVRERERERERERFTDL